MTAHPEITADNSIKNFLQQHLTNTHLSFHLSSHHFPYIDMEDRLKNSEIAKLLVTDRKFNNAKNSNNNINSSTNNKYKNSNTEYTNNWQNSTVDHKPKMNNHEIRNEPETHEILTATSKNNTPNFNQPTYNLINSLSNPNLSSIDNRKNHSTLKYNSAHSFQNTNRNNNNFISSILSKQSIHAPTAHSNKWPPMDLSIKKPKTQGKKRNFGVRHLLNSSPSSPSPLNTFYSTISINDNKDKNNNTKGNHSVDNKSNVSDLIANERGMTVESSQHKIEKYSQSQVDDKLRSDVGETTHRKSMGSPEQMNQKSNQSGQQCAYNNVSEQIGVGASSLNERPVSNQSVSNQSVFNRSLSDHSTSNQSASNLSPSNQSLSNHTPSNHSPSSDQASRSESRGSIIRTNPSITSLLLHKHITASSCKNSAPISSSLLSNIPALSSSQHNVNNHLQKYNIYKLDDSKQDGSSSTYCSSPSHDTYLPNDNANNPPFVALRSLLLKPSCLDEAKLNVDTKNNNKKHFLNNAMIYDSNNKAANYLFMSKNIGKVVTDIVEGEYEHKFKEEQVYCQQDKDCNSKMSQKHECVGCNCGCEFCPHQLNEKEINGKLNSVMEFKKAESSSCLNNILNTSKPSNDSLKIKDKKENSLVSSLLLKDGYKQNRPFLSPNVNKTLISEDYFEKELYPNSNIYIYHKSRDGYNDKSYFFSKAGNNIVNCLKERKIYEETSKERVSCNNSNSFSKGNTIESFQSEPSLTIESNKHNPCVSKRKFIEMKNNQSLRSGSVSSESIKDTGGCWKNNIDDCDASCCKRNRQCNGNLTGLLTYNVGKSITTPATTTYNNCGSTCNPSACPCPDSLADCSMETCRREQAYNYKAFCDFSNNTTDNNSVSDSSTISLIKSEPNDKFTSSLNKNASTQWNRDDLKGSFFKDFSVQCNIEESAAKSLLEIDKCQLCNCCLPKKSPDLSVSAMQLYPSPSSPQTDHSQTTFSREGQKAGDEKKQAAALKCLHCGIFFDDEVIFSIHMGSHSHQDPFTCNLCGKKCSNKYGFNTHILHGHHFGSSS